MNIFEGLHIKLDLKCYPHSVFFFKEDRCWMEYDWKNGYFGCRYEDFWEVLEREYHWETKELWCRWESFWEVLEIENEWKYEGLS